MGGRHDKPKGARAVRAGAPVHSEATTRSTHLAPQKADDGLIIDTFSKTTRNVIAGVLSTAIAAPRSTQAPELPGSGETAPQPAPDGAGPNGDSSKPKIEDEPESVVPTTARMKPSDDDAPRSRRLLVGPSSVQGDSPVSTLLAAPGDSTIVGGPSSVLLRNGTPPAAEGRPRRRKDSVAGVIAGITRSADDVRAAVAQNGRPSAKGSFGILSIDLEPDAGEEQLPRALRPQLPSAASSRKPTPGRSSSAQAERARQRVKTKPDEGARAKDIAPPSPAPSLPIPANYAEWNGALASHLMDQGRQGQIYLGTTPRALAAIINARRPEPHLSPDEAESAFRLAVAAMYTACVRRKRSGLLRLGEASVDAVPVYASLLVASVLAAYEMREDEHSRGNAYYKHLARILGTELGSDGLPRGFDPADFGELWKLFAAWLAERGVKLAYPETLDRGQRYLALPRAHVLLRRVDIAHLPEFFEWCDFGPRVRPAEAELASRLDEWTKRWRSFTRTGLRALSDGRRQAVIHQIALELEGWDGTCLDAAGRQAASVELLLDFVRRAPLLYYLARRPQAFPETFADGDRELVAGDEGWYEPILVEQDDGSELNDGFSWGASDSRRVLRRRGAVAIPLSPHTDFTGFVSGRGLPRGVVSAVLVHESVLKIATDYLSSVCDQPVEPALYGGLPRGWQLFKSVLPRRVADVPQGLEALEVLTTIELLARDGLRAGRRWAWVRGAAPTLTVVGDWHGQTAAIDGVEISVSAAGELQAGALLSEVGAHEVIVGATRRIVEIIEPAIINNAFEAPSALTSGVALPAGSWTLVGSVAGEALTLPESDRPSMLAGCPFAPVWAISRNTEHQQVLLLTSDPGAASRSPGTDGVSLERWAHAIYDAELRRPRIGSVATAAGSAVSHWSPYAALARELVRSTAQEPTTEGDRVLGWMSTLTNGSWATFRRNVESIGSRAGVNEWPRSLRLRLSDLGHADFFVAGSRAWRVLPPLLAGLGRAPSALLIGARTPALVESLRQAAIAGGCRFQVSGPRLGPCCVRIWGERQDLRAVADLVGIAFVDDYPSLLCRSVESVTSIGDRCEAWPEPVRWAIRTLDFDSGRWVDGISEGVSVREYKPRYGEPVFCVASGARLSRMPKRDAVYLAASLSRRHLASYDRRTRVLTVPRFAPLPERLARIAALCSAGSAIESGELLAFDDVPFDVASVVCVAAGQAHPGVDWQHETAR